MYTGQMRERVTIRQRLTTLDAVGAPVHTWQDLATVWARVMPVRSTVGETAERLASLNIYEVTLRWQSTLGADDQIVWRGRTLQLRGQQNLDEHQRYLTLTAEDARAD